MMPSTPLPVVSIYMSDVLSFTLGHVQGVTVFIATGAPAHTTSGHQRLAPL